MSKNAHKVISLRISICCLVTILISNYVKIFSEKVILIKTRPDMIASEWILTNENKKIEFGRFTISFVFIFYH